MKGSFKGIEDVMVQTVGKGKPTPSQDKDRNPNRRNTKRTNKPEFNRMAKKRRRKAKFDARGRKINQRVARRKRK